MVAKKNDNGNMEQMGTNKQKNAKGLEESNLIGCMNVEIIKYWGGIT